MALEGLGGQAREAHNVVHAVVANSPVSPTAELFVVIPSHGIETWGPIAWRPAGTVLPMQGGDCLVAFDERGIPWLVAYAGTAPPEAILSEPPAAPYDGQLINFQNAAMAEAGVVWCFRYRAGSASPYKWEFTGGSALTTGTPQGSVEFAAVEEKPLTGGPVLTTPLSGVYEIGLRLRALAREAALVEMAGLLRANGVAYRGMYLFIDALAFGSTETTNYETVSLTAGDVLTIGCKLQAAVKSLFLNGWLSILPVRVI